MIVLFETSQVLITAPTISKFRVLSIIEPSIVPDVLVKFVTIEGDVSTVSLLPTTFTANTELVEEACVIMFSFKFKESLLLSIDNLITSGLSDTADATIFEDGETTRRPTCSVEL